jgi:hypothetical protein
MSKWCSGTGKDNLGIEFLKTDLTRQLEDVHFARTYYGCTIYILPRLINVSGAHWLIHNRIQTEGKSAAVSYFALLQNSGSQRMSQQLLHFLDITSVRNHMVHVKKRMHVTFVLIWNDPIGQHIPACAQT